MPLILRLRKDVISTHLRCLNHSICSLFVEMLERGSGDLNKNAPKIESLIFRFYSVPFRCYYPHHALLLFRHMFVCMKQAIDLLPQDTHSRTNLVRKLFVLKNKGRAFCPLYITERSPLSARLLCGFAHYPFSTLIK